MGDIIYIEPSANDILTYKKNISVSISSTSVNNFTFGFINVDQIILCHYNTDLNDELTIELINPKKINNLFFVEEKAKQLNIKKLLTFCLMPLKKWYEMLGFKSVGIIYLSPNAPKVCKMVKLNF